MRIAVSAIGRLKAGAERELCAHYLARLGDAGRAVALGPPDLSELAESRARSAELRKADEGGRLLASVPKADLVLALDEHGRALTSRQFAELLGARRDAGVAQAAFLIGGPDGHGAAVLERANLKLSLGSLTLPHGLARIVLVEQLYRAASILSGHPYHRD